MASDLERTLIAARYSSRELSKLLHGLFLPDEDPLVVVDTDDHRTVAMTGADDRQLVGPERCGGKRSDGDRDDVGCAHPELARDLAVDIDLALDAWVASPPRPERARHRLASAPPRRRTWSPIRSRQSRRHRSCVRPTRARSASNGWCRRSGAVWPASGCGASSGSSPSIAGLCVGLAVVAGAGSGPGTATRPCCSLRHPLRPSPRSSTASQPDGARAGGQAEEAPTSAPQGFARHLARRRHARPAPTAPGERAAPPLGRAAKTVRPSPRNG